MKDGHELTEEYREQALDEARALGEKLAPTVVCGYCADIGDVFTPQRDEELKRIAGWRIEDDGVPFFRPSPEPPTDGHRHFHDEVFEAAREAFRENAAPPERCDVCLDDGVTCSHERHDPDGCPV